jgi:hypothetical protein
MRELGGTDDHSQPSRSVKIVLRKRIKFFLHEASSVVVDNFYLFPEKCRSSRHPYARAMRGEHSGFRLPISIQIDVYVLDPIATVHGDGVLTKPT